MGGFCASKGTHFHLWHDSQETSCYGSAHYGGAHMLIHNLILHTVMAHTVVAHDTSRTVIMHTVIVRTIRSTYNVPGTMLGSSHISRSKRLSEAGIAKPM